MTDISRRVFSTSSVRALHTPEDPPQSKDVLYSWVVCFAACFVQVITVGILNSFGVIFVELREEFKVSKAELSWIASLAFGISLLLGPLAGKFRLRFGTRVALCCGGISCALSLLTSSFVPNTKALFGTFSLLYAIGGGLVINSTTILAPDYFDRYAAVATGIVVAGGSFGTLLFSCLGEMWVESVGWRTTFRIYSGISLLTFFLGLLIRPVKKPPLRLSTLNDNHPNEVQPVRKIKLWENRAYVVWVLCITCAMFGYFIPYVHLISYAVDIGLSKESGSILIMVLGGTSALGRLLFGKVLSFQFLNKRQIYQLSMMITATSTMMLPISTSMGALVVYAVVQGIADGCNVVLVPLLTRIYAGDTNVPMAWGILNGFSSITFTLGPPVAGWMSDATGSYNVSFHIAGIPMIAAAAILFFIPWAQHTTKRAPGAGCPDAVSNQHNGDAFSPMEQSHVIVGLPVTDTTTSLAVSRDSRVLNNLPTESQILNESRWSWSSIHRTSSIEIPPPQGENTLHNTVSARGIEMLSASEESESGFVIIDAAETMDGASQSPVHVARGDELQRVNSPVVIDNSIVEALVDLNEESESQSNFEELVKLNESCRSATESFERVEGTVPLSDENEPTEDNTGLSVVIPDYVVEKLVELNENEQNKTNSEAVIDTLVDLSDNENDIDEMAIDSGANRIIESEEPASDENRIDQRVPRKTPFSRQSSESQCIIPNSVVETLENLAQSSPDEVQSETLNDNTETDTTLRDTHGIAHMLQPDSSLWQADSSYPPVNSAATPPQIGNEDNHQNIQDPWADAIPVQSPDNSQTANSSQWNVSNHDGLVSTSTSANSVGYNTFRDSAFYGQGEVSCNALPLHQSINTQIQNNSAQTNVWQPSHNRSMEHGGSQWNTGFAQSQTATNERPQLVATNMPFNTRMSANLTSVQGDTCNAPDNINLGHNSNQWNTGCVQSQTGLTDQYPHSNNYQSVKNDTWQPSNNTIDARHESQWNSGCVQSQTMVTDSSFKSCISSNLNSVQADSWQAPNNTNTDNTWIHINPSCAQSQSGANAQTSSSANLNSAQLADWKTSNNGNVQWSTDNQHQTVATDQSPRLNNFKTGPTDGWQPSQSCNADQVGVQTNSGFVQLQNINDSPNAPISTNPNSVHTDRWHLSNDTNLEQWNENSVQSPTRARDQLFSLNADHISTSTTQWVDNATSTTQWVDNTTTSTTQWVDNTTSTTQWVDHTTTSTNQWADQTNTSTTQWADQTNTSTTQWIDHTTQQFLESTLYPETVSSTVDSLNTFTASKGFSSSSIYQHSQAEISSNVNSTTVFDSLSKAVPTLPGDNSNTIQNNQPSQSGSRLPQNGLNDWWTDNSHPGQAPSISQTDTVRWCDPVSDNPEQRTTGSSPNSRQSTENSQQMGQTDQTKSTPDGCSNPFTEDIPSQTAVDTDALTTFDRLWTNNQCTETDKDNKHEG